MHFGKKSFWAAAAVIVAGVIYYAYDPGRTPGFPKCPFLTVTGLQCPGCGSQRALHSLLHGDLAVAAGYNALLVFSIPLLLLLLYAETCRRRHPRFYTRLHRPAYILAYLAAVILWTVARNVF